MMMKVKSMKENVMKNKKKRIRE